MSQVSQSAGAELGIGGKANGVTFTPNTGNQSLGQYVGQNSVFNDPTAMGYLSDYARGGSDANTLFGKEEDNQLNGGGNLNQLQGFQNAMATGATTGSRYATEQVQNNDILGGLFGKNGQLNKAESKLDDLNNQGFELKPEDHTLYGQTSGNIARMFGAQGNQAAQDLASRGLASAPSGAAGAMFSGIAGNQNEQLAQAQQQIMQQRFQNTQNQIAQQHSFISQMGQQGANAIQQQYGRQLSGAQNQTGQLSGAASDQNQANASDNQARLAAAGFDQANKPFNVGDMPAMTNAAFAPAFGSAFGSALGGMSGGGGAGGGKPKSGGSMGAGSGASAGNSYESNGSLA